MNSNRFPELLAALPAIRKFSARSWPKWYGADFYGAMAVASRYCGFGVLEPPIPGVWQHGVMPPWLQVQPEIIVYGAPRSMRCFVGRQDEAVYLQRAGYSDVHAIGLPISYTEPSGATRIPGSILVMPPHILRSCKTLPDTRPYLEQVPLLKDRFHFVAACVSPPCIERGIWVEQLEAVGVPVVTGAAIDDANALPRMRALFESFEVVTTTGFGSHVFYALAFGAKVSIWGPDPPPQRENLMIDNTWAAFPDAIDRALSQETKMKAEKTLGPLRVPPWEAVGDVMLGRRMTGWDNRLSSAEMRRLFGWTASRLRFHEGKLRLARSLPWRGAKWLRRKLNSLSSLPNSPTACHSPR